jgi:hypothetical protein
MEFDNIMKWIITFVIAVMIATLTMYLTFSNQDPSYVYVKNETINDATGIFSALQPTYSDEVLRIEDDFINKLEPSLNIQPAQKNAKKSNNLIIEPIVIASAIPQIPPPKK